MELIEIKRLFVMDYGAPSPTIISNDNDLIISFYSDTEEDQSFLFQRNSVYDNGIVVINFKGFMKYSFGMPNNESMQGHPYYKLGMRGCSFYELKSSNLIDELKEISKIHPYHNPDRWKKYKHFILTFHDNMFECVAESFEIREEKTSIYKEASSLLKELFIRDL